MTTLINQTISVGTDEAAWFLYHPDDLAYRADDPMGWCYSDFAVSKEFAAGTLIGVGTGSDGSFRVRFTNEAITERERAYTACSREFRLRVQHDRLYLDGGYTLPSEEIVEPEFDSDGWLELPKGNYRAIVYALAWYNEPGATDDDGYSTPQALTSYVVEFQPVDQLEAITPPTVFPQLDSYRPELDSYPSPPLLTPLEVSGTYRFIERPKVVFPGIATELPLSETEYEQLQQQIDTQAGWEAEWEVVIGSTLEAQTVGTFFRFSSLSAGGYPTERFAMSGCGQQLVCLQRVFEQDSVLWAEVVSYKPGAEPAEEATVKQLQQRFADYAAHNADYQQRVRSHRFYAERIAALTEARSIAWFVANALDLTLAQQQELLTLSEHHLINRLIQLLEP